MDSYVVSNILLLQIILYIHTYIILYTCWYICKVNP